MNEFFKDYRIKAYCRDFITFLSFNRDHDGTIIEKQRAVNIHDIHMIVEAQDGIRIDVEYGKDMKVYYINGATMKQASYAISQSQSYILRQQ